MSTVARAVGVFGTALLLGSTWLSQAQAADALILGVRDSTSATQADVLRPALRFDGTQWQSLDDALAGRATATTPARALPTLRAAPGAAQIRIALPVLAEVAFGDKSIDLQHWFEYPVAANAPPQTHDAVLAVQTRWGCSAAWAIELTPSSVRAPLPLLLSNRSDLQARYASPATAVALDTSPWQTLLGRWRAAEAAAIKTWQQDTNGTPSALRIVAAAPRNQQPLESAELREIALGGEAGRLQFVTAMKYIGAAARNPESCAEPMLVYRAVLRAQGEAAPTLLQHTVEVQTCSEGWQPAPRERPWLVLQVAGKALLALWTDGLESSRLQLYALDPKTWQPAATAVASGAESGC